MLLPKFTTLSLALENNIAHLQLNRPERANAINRPMWQELGEAMAWASNTADVRVVVLSAEGKHFCSGIDLSMLNELIDESISCDGRKREALRQDILWLQTQLTAIEQCRKPVLGAIHGLCIGGGVDLISACDMRYCTDDAVFSIKEIDVGLVADVGTLQRLPRLIGDGVMRELVYTGRDFNGGEATRLGLTNQCFSDKETMLKEVFAIASTIASKSPLSVRGNKQVILYSREHSIADGLDYVATWNAAMLISDDIKIALKAQQARETPHFEN
ncbi:MAG: crotonase/enoyl-CoA hydratase family protein [Gammaproteobacteria bacterium]|nr:crotonase/enoyl-CoA hydratase family protein [Gammaproteobacteria bacterium]MBQ0840667.1 crotonase/enoyl-CoA hydratase family protein [Gammaproteobacteria bacterium]